MQGPSLGRLSWELCSAAAEGAARLKWDGSSAAKVWPCEEVVWTTARGPAGKGQACLSTETHGHPGTL